ncbi:hypothetical protein [Pseudobutyrivibrio sp.]|jgi:preprotein translocase subunit Sss1|uniref:hypothetical protein n=1 Tax=Pseudobutyrivibrio sp. TaxID=2014367 RepID=UPI001D90C891|nr:hypothetical protein [Pseudobutyrivibrio sp.]MBE5912297.1 hypothetical protein [Pseudobutyrivibrio sp.]
MSQEKVDKKKYEKTHRRSLLRKKKLEEFFSIACVSIIGLAIVGWIGFSIYTKVQESQAELAASTIEYHEINASAIQDYVSTLN